MAVWQGLCANLPCINSHRRPEICYQCYCNRVTTTSCHTAADNVWTRCWYVCIGVPPACWVWWLRSLITVVVVIVTQNWDLVADVKCDGQSCLSGCISDQSPVSFSCVSYSCVPYHLMSDMMFLSHTNLLHSSIVRQWVWSFDWQSMISVILAKTAKPKTVVVVVEQFLWTIEQTN